MWPPFWFLAPSAAKSWRRAWTASENYCKCEPTYEVNVAEINSCEYKHQVEHFFLEHFGLAKYIKTNKQHRNGFLVRAHTEWAEDNNY